MNSITLDWLAFTSVENTYDFTRWIHLYASDNAAISITPTNGYRTAYKAKTGVMVQWNVDREEMGYHVVIAGTALRNLLEHNELDQTALLLSVVNTGARITRLDIALDIQGEKPNLDNVYKKLAHKEYKGSARTISQLHSPNGGNTIYIGSRQSEKFIRIYDKAAQQGLQGEVWTRFELETKGMVARSMAKLLIDAGKDWLPVFAGTTGDMVDIPNSADWRILRPDSAHVGIPKIEKSSDRERWIETQVIPAVAKHFAEYPDSRAVKRLIDTLELLARKE